MRGKFDRFVIGPDSRLTIAFTEAGSGPLRLCKFDSADPLYIATASTASSRRELRTSSLGKRPCRWLSDTYQATQHTKSLLRRTCPFRRNIACDWPYAVRRYNGSGPNSYDYQAEFLLKFCTPSRLLPFADQPLEPECVFRECRSIRSGLGPTAATFATITLRSSPLNASITASPKSMTDLTALTRFDPRPSRSPPDR